ncbi:uncharacterized protein Aud_009531 [Aspergillus udagawae]|uniref:Uncharacterized protein n=1 Tax=Aspergillus udagawae TaxID=91492 RepID=A0A8E0QZ61_9EURO|nr:uncharacterized protein Aud_009531 [Aspergillus udagawae]GIC93052.1 hypothetical protein Aud_009531 [Aspergillus udagawae]
MTPRARPAGPDEREGQIESDYSSAVSEIFSDNDSDNNSNSDLEWISDSEETVGFLYGFFAWRCDIRRGKKGRHCPVIKYKSSLESFWKSWHLVLKQETAVGLSKEIQVKVQDAIAIVAEEKGLELMQQM